MKFWDCNIQKPDTTNKFDCCYLADIACILVNALASEAAPLHKQEQESREQDSEAQSQEVEDSWTADDQKPFLFVVPVCNLESKDSVET